jgi:L-seryl-tRNA(Ser) seleniumtransferase
VLLHTNLGRAPLSAAARAALEVAAGTCDVELDLVTGERGARGAGAIDALLAAVPAAAAAHVANNGAAALALVALTLAQGREMVVARGELVEIGDGFRIPALLEATGARLREVGTTNRVTRADYAAAIGEDTAFVLKVHPSNFVVRGFTSACGVDELAGLGVPVVADIGSGLLAPHPLLPDEPDAATALAQGAALVTASGDKLLGGPQAGPGVRRARRGRRGRGADPAAPAGQGDAGGQAHVGRAGGDGAGPATAGAPVPRRRARGPAAAGRPAGGGARRPRRRGPRHRGPGGWGRRAGRRAAQRGGRAAGALRGRAAGG